MDGTDNKAGSGFVSGVFLTIIVISLIWGIGKSGKYEGQTSEEWFDDYDSCEAELETVTSNAEDYQSCVESEFEDSALYCSLDTSY